MDRKTTDQALWAIAATNRYSIVTTCTPVHERGPSYSPNVTDQQLNQPIPLSSHIQGISVRMVSHCGQPNTAQYGDCNICGRNYEQNKVTAVLIYVEVTTYRD